MTQKLRGELGRPPEDDEIAAEIGLDLEAFYAALYQTRNMPVLSLEDMGITKESGEPQSLLECLAGKRDADPHVQMRLEELKEAIARGIDQLPETTVLLLLDFLRRLRTCSFACAI